MVISNFPASGLAWTIKHKRSLSEKSYVEAKAHLGFTFWGNSMYNSDIFNDTYLGNTYSTYGVGENVKLFFTASHQKWGKLEFAALGYHLVGIAVNESHSEGHVFFVNGSVSYEFPITARIGIGIKQSFSGLFGMYDTAEDVNRIITPTGLYIRIRSRENYEKQNNGGLAPAGMFHRPCHVLRHLGSPLSAFGRPEA